MREGEAVSGRSPNPRRVLLLGATGTIGRATARALAVRGHRVVCVLRPESKGRAAALPPEITLRYGHVGDPRSLREEGLRGERFDALVSCLAARTGAPKEAWAIDHRATVDALTAAKEAGATQAVLLSAICVQKPRLAFQHAKLAAEEAFASSGLSYSIVRPTAFFKSLSGQIERVRRGKPFLVFGDGRQTACKPIGDDDCAAYLADCLEEESRWNRILPIGGPGPAITPRGQAACLSTLLGREVPVKQVPLAMMRGIAMALGGFGKIVPPLAEKAEFARIATYYGTESMLLLDPATGRYDAEATPSYGSETLFDHYRRVLAGETSVELGAHSLFDRET